MVVPRGSVNYQLRFDNGLSMFEIWCKFSNSKV